MRLAESILLHKYIQIHCGDERTVAVDFDGVLAHWKKGSSLKTVGKPLAKGLKLLKILIDRGYKVIVHTARPDLMHGKMERWLLAKGLKVQVTSRKPPAIAYVDDRAVNSDQSLEDILKQIKGLEP